VTRKLKPVQVEVSEEIKQAVLGIPVQSDGTLTTVGELLGKAREAVELANSTLAENALICFTASHLMRGEKRRGTPTIRAHLDGSVTLHVAYDEGSLKEPSPALKPKLPSLDDLRKQAELLEVDISDLGRHKLQIMTRLDEKREGTSDHR